MSKEQIREKLSRTETPDIDSTDVDMAMDAPVGETAAQKRRAQQDWLNYLNQRDSVDVQLNVHDAETGAFKSVDIADDGNEAYYNNLVDSAESNNRSGMGLLSLAQAAAEARERGDKTILGDIEDEINDRLLEQADKYGWDNDATMSRLDRINSIIYGDKAVDSENGRATLNGTDSAEPDGTGVATGEVIDEISEAPQTIARAMNAINSPNITPEQRAALNASLLAMRNELDSELVTSENELSKPIDSSEEGEPLENRNELDDEEGEPLQNRNETDEDEDEPLQNRNETDEEGEPLENKRSAWSKVIGALQTAKYNMWDKPSYWIAEKMTNRNFIKRKDGETDDEFEKRQERHGKILVGLGYAAAVATVAWAAHRAINGISGGHEGAVDSNSMANMADFHKMQDTNTLPNIDHTTVIDTPVYPTDAYVESGSGEIQETQQALQQALGHDVSLNDAERVYKAVGGDIFTNDSNYSGPTGDIRIGQSGTYQFRDNFVKKAVEAYNNITR